MILAPEKEALWRCQYQFVRKGYDMLRLVLRLVGKMYILAHIMGVHLFLWREAIELFLDIEAIDRRVDVCENIICCHCGNLRACSALDLSFCPRIESLQISESIHDMYQRNLSG